MDVMDSTNPGISLKSLCAGVLLEPLNEAEVEVAENKVRLLQDIIDKYEEEIKGMKKERTSSAAQSALKYVKMKLMS